MDNMILKTIKSAVEEVIEDRRSLGESEVTGALDSESDSVLLRSPGVFELAIPIADCLTSGYETKEEFKKWFDLIIAKASNQFSRKNITARGKVKPAVAPKKREEDDEEFPDLSSQEIDYKKKKDF